ncbi:phage tail sheath family protein [Streptomyces netropsis]
MPTTKSPGVYVKEAPSGSHTIGGASTSIPAFIGYTPNGVKNTPTLVRSWKEYLTQFATEFEPSAEASGGKNAEDTPPDLSPLYLAEAVFGFFANGGAQCYIVSLDSNIHATDMLGKPLTALAGVRDVSMVAFPSLWAFTEKQGEGKEVKQDPISATNGAALQQKLIDHCAAMGDRLAILDPPYDDKNSKDASDKQVADYRSKELTTKQAFGTLYFPWITVPGLDKEHPSVTVPPSGHVAGVWAYTDATRGVFKAPANEALKGVTSLAATLTDDTQSPLNEAGVNCLRAFPGRGLLVWGARTLTDPTDDDWRYLNVRRYVSFLRRSILDGTLWAVFEPNDERLWAGLSRTVTAFLKDQWRIGALQGPDPGKAFYVICDASNNDATSIKNGEVHCDIGVAIVRPAEFVEFTITQKLETS